jgi:hypothetical protein
MLCIHALKDLRPRIPTPAKVSHGTANSVNTIHVNPQKGVFAVLTAAVLQLQGAAYAFAAPPPLGECVTESNPQATTISCRQLGMVEGRLRQCNPIENCVSTSAKAAKKYRPPWRYDLNPETSDVDTVWSKLLSAIDSEKLTVIKSDKDKRYILAGEKNVPKQPSGASLFYEFLIRESDGLVLYRGLVDKTVLLYPLQQPVSDFGALDKRLDGVLSRTGWLKVENN